ncbi:hypothetical protein RE6C_03540 [Rhodopirellula europaea 6C]|uniref:Uncharacterized protein n=1 Tax=Rhodopirellula europaea 6C TaxID=1263867 RepID=M2A5S8_9BACT|nr:hypothetical protein RE6C_03540 [Rhodopirellula europaea 6C]
MIVVRLQAIVMWQKKSCVIASPSQFRNSGRDGMIARMLRSPE